MNVIQEIQRINDLELQKGITNTSASWHTKYSESAWVYFRLPTALSEGDIIAVMSQWGEIEDINLVREENKEGTGTGKSKGFGFLKYEDARSCVLAVDNFNGSKILGFSMRVDHVEKYRLPKHIQEREKEEKEKGYYGRQGEEKKQMGQAGHAYEGKELKTSFNIHDGQDLFAPVSPHDEKGQDHEDYDDRGLSKAERKEAKRKRKDQRDQKRLEKEARREEREERRREKRAKKMNRDSNQDHKKKRKRPKNSDDDS
jgi:RNA-binding motif X-linked protein 2